MAQGKGRWRMAQGEGRWRMARARRDGGIDGEGAWMIDY